MKLLPPIINTMELPSKMDPLPEQQDPISEEHLYLKWEFRPGRMVRLPLGDLEVTGSSNETSYWLLPRHEKFCLGSYNKIAEPPGYEGKGSKGRNKHQNDGPKESSSASRNKAARTHKAGDNKDKSYVKRSRTITKFFPVVDTGNLDVDNSSSNGSSQKHLRDDSSKAIVIKLPDDMVPGQIARDVRSHASGKKRKFTDVSKKFYGHGKKYTVMSGWLDWYAEVESYKDIEPLINKRTERRKKQKIFTNSKRKVIEDKTMADASQRKGVDLKIVRSIDPAAPSGDRGANWCRVPGFCRDMDRRDLAADDVVPHLNHSSKVNILEISDD